MSPYHVRQVLSEPLMARYKKPLVDQVCTNILNGSTVPGSRHGKEYCFSGFEVNVRSVTTRETHQMDSSLPHVKMRRSAITVIGGMQN